MTPEQQSKEFQLKAQKVRDEIVKLLEENEVILVPQIQMSEQGIIPTMAFQPKPKPPVVEVPESKIITP